MDDPEVSQYIAAGEQMLRQHLAAGKVRACARHHEMAGKPYRPSSGTEGMWFSENWCDHCTRDLDFDPDSGDGGCQIIADTFAYEVTDERYPKEWVYDRDGRPSCKAFTTDPSKPIRCDKTLDMFDGQ